VVEHEKLKTLQSMKLYKKGGGKVQQIVEQLRGKAVELSKWCSVFQRWVDTFDALHALYRFNAVRDISFKAFSKDGRIVVEEVELPATSIHVPHVSITELDISRIQGLIRDCFNQILSDFIDDVKRYSEELRGELLEALQIIEEQQDP